MGRLVNGRWLAEERGARAVGGRYARELHQYPGVAATVDLDHIKGHYYASHASINPTGIVPKGPEIDFALPHDRRRLAARSALARAA